MQAQSLRYHDFHLRGYAASDFGTTIALDLVYDYPGHDKAQSRISFSEVACYSFVHTSGAIITDIDEVPVTSLVADEAAFFTEQAHLLGVPELVNDSETRGRR
jgi:hypothetical protein